MDGLAKDRNLPKLTRTATLTLEGARVLQPKNLRSHKGCCYVLACSYAIPKHDLFPISVVEGWSAG
jgi:hypothetical protein